MSGILGNTHDRSAAFGPVFGTVVLLVLLGDCRNFFFDKMFSKSYINVFYLSKKQQNGL